MIKHVIIWDLKDSLSAEEKTAAALKIKNSLEALAGLEGVLKMKVYIEPALTSNCDILLDSEFENEDAFNRYQDYPAHVAVKDYIASVRKERKCFDGVK